ncbi:EF-P 5-aminopentanol modification-associated protein YfmF [Texcoconibacillus texcoconensis]|uniref:Putative Zn-dependent peptidase n=1 Tax=Texcoconibacillus texcoconensis TaxID=1095777 RepID=A0A840QH81_9BACI|nr:pitrilysin family protein [Texcoconibacillus texcoconensis]MBB5172012.1 putative Zn-dependent peptidase [Texcoconibacillus texcoconensis]
MEAINEKTFQIGPLNVHLVESQTYKTNTLVLHMKAPLKQETVTKRALLPSILQSASEDYPSRQQVRSALDELYGATLQADVGKKGENQLISFRMDVANEKFLKADTPLLKEALSMLASIVLRPKLEDGAFASEVVNAEKRTLKQRLASVYDDKMRYANKRLTEEMCAEEPYGLFVYGKEEEVDEIDPSSLYEYYKQVLKKDKLDLYVVGDVDEDTLKTLLLETMTFPERDNNNQETAQEPTKPAIKEPGREVIEEQDIQQGKLHLGYRTNVTYRDDNYFALQVFNGLFGGSSHSKLFLNVREKESLAYYASSRVESHKGLMMVMSGIEPAKYDRAVDIIHKQMEDMKNGEFTDQELDQTKAVLKNQLLETMDVPRGLVELSYHNELTGVDRPLHKWFEAVDNVTKEDVTQVANQIELDTIYFLKGKEA